MSEAEQIYFNPWDEAFRANPYPYYKPLMTGPPRLLNVFLPMALVLATRRVWCFPIRRCIPGSAGW